MSQPSLVPAGDASTLPDGDTGQAPASSRSIRTPTPPPDARAPQQPVSSKDDRKSAHEAPGSGDLGSEGLATAVVQAPLSKLWELDRLEMEKQREELRSLRGELRNVRAGEHTRYREEKAAHLQLQQAIAELITNADEEDSFTLETLLRALEAGRERTLSPKVSQSGEDHKMLLLRRSKQQQAAVRVAAMTLLSVGLVQLVRRTKLGLQVRRATAFVVTGCRSAIVNHMSWLLVPACRTAQRLARGTPADGSETDGLVSRSSGASASAAAAARAASAQAMQETLVTGYNAGLHTPRRSWARPWTFLNPQPQSSGTPPPPLPPPHGIHPAGTPQITRPQAAVPVNQLYASSSSPQLQALPFHEYQHPFMGRRSFDPIYMPVHGAGSAVSPPMEPVEEGRPVHPMKASSSESQILSYSRVAAAHSAPESPTYQSPVPGSWAASKPGFVNRAIKADHLTAPTNVSLGWQSRYGLEPPLRAAKLHGKDGEAGGKPRGPALPELSAVSDMDGGEQGVSYRMIVEDAAELPAVGDGADLSNGKEQQSDYQSVFLKHQNSLSPLHVPKTTRL